VDFDTNAEAVRERISGTVAALLGLVGVKADPVRSREAILLANIFEHAWRQNQHLDLAQLILSLQNPPVRQLGVFDVDTFYPQKDRFELAMAFNNLMAAPSFQSWLQGEPLDVDRLFYTLEGKPRHSIFYIAHLSDNERMFFVTLLLENILTWMRRQTGTTSLRALLYFDEVFGFFPPTAEPPSKRPLLTLLKQARAFGLGCVLVTQNPVDLDYKGLTNAGTWFIGKLQAERDKLRVLEGLEGAIVESGGDASPDFDNLISRLDNRVFLLHNVHGDGPVVFNTRWAMSYLRGPLTRPQVRQLVAAPTSAPPAAALVSPQSLPPSLSHPATVSPPLVSPAGPSAPAGFSPSPPALEPDLQQVYLPIEVTDSAAVSQLTGEARSALNVRNVQLIYEPAVLGAATVRFVDRKRQVDEQIEKLLLTPPSESLVGADWAKAEPLSLSLRDLLRSPARVEAEQGPFFAPAPEQANSARKLNTFAKDLAEWLYYNNRLSLTVHAELGLHQNPGERERDFKIRLQQSAREARDAEVDKVENQYATQLGRLRDKLEKKRRELIAGEAEYEARKQHEWIGIGESVLGFFLGRRSTRALSSAASRRRLTAQARVELEEGQAEVTELEKEVGEMEDELKARMDEITLKWANLLDDLTREEIAPRRSDVNVQMVALAWLPSWVIRYSDSSGERAATIAAYALTS
jgi:hypothetical protein